MTMHIYLCGFQIKYRIKQCTPTIMILLTTAVTYHSLNWFGHLIFVLHTGMNQNIANLLTHTSVKQNQKYFCFFNQLGFHRDFFASSVCFLKIIFFNISFNEPSSFEMFQELVIRFSSTFFLKHHNQQQMFCHFWAWLQEINQHCRNLFCAVWLNIVLFLSNLWSFWGSI